MTESPYPDANLVAEDPERRKAAKRLAVRRNRAWRKWALPIVGLGLGVGFVLWRTFRGGSTIDAITATTTVATPTETDVGVAFLDAWAKIADIIAFYQDRVADEEWLRTRNELGSTLYLSGTTPTYRRALNDGRDRQTQKREQVDTAVIAECGRLLGT